ncbi:MAG: 4Fe-4S binding protein [Coriobacteriia bacterium]|nr:4Fe-4S binding protein [Coriobacteriia bacterium]
MSEKTHIDVSDFENWTYDMIPKGAVCTDVGNSVQYITGGWRSNMPIWKKKNCKDCLLCWVHCPDASILVVDGKMTGIDYDHCKGCGICARECKYEALTMVAESSDEALAVKKGA